MTKVYLEPEEISRIEQSVTNIRDKILIRLLFHLGCRISEALSLEIKDINFTQGSVVIQHLKLRLNLACPNCGARLGRTHSFCSKCGVKVEEAVAKEQEHRRMRTLPLDEGTLEMMKDYIERGGPVLRDGKKLIFGINRHRAWQIVRECAKKASLPDADGSLCRHGSQTQ